MIYAGERSNSDPEKRYNLSKNKGRSSVSVSCQAGTPQQESINENSSDGRIKRLPSGNAYGDVIRIHGEKDDNKEQPEVSSTSRGLSLESKPRQSRNERK